jgi:hypothetical protein
MNQRTVSGRLHSYTYAAAYLYSQSPPYLMLICRGVSEEDNSALTKQEQGRLTVDCIMSLIRHSVSSLGRRK